MYNNTIELISYFICQLSLLELLLLDFAWHVTLTSDFVLRLPMLAHRVLRTAQNEDQDCGRTGRHCHRTYMLLPQKLQFGLPTPTELMWGLIIIVNYYDDKVFLNKVMFFFAIKGIT